MMLFFIWLNDNANICYISTQRKFFIYLFYGIFQIFFFVVIPLYIDHKIMVQWNTKHHRTDWIKNKQNAE